MDGTEHTSGEIEVFVEMIERYLIDGIYPNPFSASATLAYAVRETQDVTVRLYDAMGRLVRTVFDAQVEGNKMQRLRIGGSGLAGGMYLIRLRGVDFEEVVPVAIVR